MRSGQRLLPWRTRSVTLRPIPFCFDLTKGGAFDIALQLALPWLAFLAAFATFLLFVVFAGGSIVAVAAMLVYSLVFALFGMHALGTWNRVRIMDDGVRLTQRRFIWVFRRINIEPRSIVAAVVPCRFSHPRYRPRYKRRWSAVIIAESGLEADRHVVVGVHPDKDTVLECARESAAVLDGEFGLEVQRVHADRRLYEGHASRQFGLRRVAWSERSEAHERTV